MLGQIRNYMVYRRHGLRNAWRYADMSSVLEKMGRWLCYLTVSLMVIYLISDTANAVSEATDNRSAARISQQAAYIKTLEAFLDRCMRPGENVVWIGNQLHFCGMTNTRITR